MDFQNLGTSLLKYVLEGLAVAIASRLLTNQRISLQEVALIGLTAALTFFILDSLAPSIAPGARKGAGFGLGYQGVTMTGAPSAIIAGVEPFTDVVPANVTADEGEKTAETAVAADAAAAAETKVTEPACFKLNPLVNAPKQCECSMNCEGCGPELKCPVDCTPKTREQGACEIDCCNIESTGCPYKIIPGQYSHQVILPGYNECVKPFNFYQRWK